MDASEKPHRIAFNDMATGLRFVNDALIRDAHARGYEGWGWLAEDVATKAVIYGLATRLIESGFLRGVINGASQCVVVSRKEPFPALSQVCFRWMSRELWHEPRMLSRQIVDEDDE
jgi:hypothetical protein